MRRGTTPYIHFHISQLDMKQMKKIEIAFRQNEETVVKSGQNVKVEGAHDFSVKLTQEDTLSFRAHRPIEVQARFIGADDNVIATTIRKIDCNEILNDEVISDE